MKKDRTIKLKVCGMRESRNILEVSKLLPDYMGFIFYKKSPRFIGEQFKLPEDFPAEIKKVGVFVNASSDEMKKQQETFSLDVLQLHGDETPEQLRELKASKVTIFKVFSIDENFNFDTTKPFAEYADYFLFDTKGKNYGGNGQRFKWTILEKYDQSTPFILSGGLNPENIRQGRELQGMNLHGFDLNSGVESEPGLKDPDKIRSVQVELKKLEFNYY
jgi:phosphoribosylanthranilate isomerase